MLAAHLDPAVTGGVGVAFTDRWGGVSDPQRGPLTLAAPAAGDRPAAGENLRRVCERLGVIRVALANQVHGRVAVRVGPGEASDLATAFDVSSPRPEADALWTTERGVALCVRVADCVPVVLADARAGVVGVAHAGRRGLVDGVLQATISALHGAGATDLQAWVGPHVCPRCYEVPADLAEECTAVIPELRATSAAGTPALDLGAGVRAVLKQEGVVVTDLARCTAESADLHSYRRDGQASGRLGALVWLADPVAISPLSPT